MQLRGMNLVTTSELLKTDLGTKVAAFFNLRELSPLTFAVVSEYRDSKFSNAPLDHKGTASRLTKKYGIPFEQVAAQKIISKVRRDSSASIEEYRRMLLESIASDSKLQTPSIGVDQQIALGIVGLRGSPDGKNFYSIDSGDMRRSDHVNNAESFLRTYRRIPYNINRRRPGHPKDDQIRINMEWVWANLLSEIESINPYKYLVIQASYR